MKITKTRTSLTKAAKTEWAVCLEGIPLVRCYLHSPRTVGGAVSANYAVQVLEEKVHVA